MSKSSVISISETQSSENTSILPYNDITDSDSVFDDDLSIALCKGKRTCIYHLSFAFILFTLVSFLFCLHFFLDSYSVLKSVSEAMFILSWKDVMKEEMLALEQNET